VTASAGCDIVVVMSKRGKRKAVPAIVPRFLKGAVTLGVIPALAGGCEKPRPVQPVVAYFAPPAPQDAMRPPVVAAYQPAPPVDAGVDAPKKAPVDAPAAPPPPPPPVVAAMVPPPAVVAAYVPRGSAAPKPPKKKP
jgi:hypothetical protein